MTPTENAAPAARRHKALVVLDRTARIALAVFFAAAAVPKLADLPAAAGMFAQIGAGPWFQYAVGAAELAGAIGLLIPRLSRLAAAGLCLDMAGASMVNAAILHNSATIFTIVLAVAFALLAARRPQRATPFKQNGREASVVATQALGRTRSEQRARRQ